MAKIVTHGEQPLSAPPGTFREIHFPKLMLLDQGTTEGFLSRLFESDGASVRDLPLSISMQYVDDEGHMGAVPIGALHEVRVDGEAGLMSGKGWLADTPDGHLGEILVLSKAMQGNSADIGDVPPAGLTLDFEGDPWDDDFKLTARFTEFNLVKTTLVQTPAFAGMKGALPDEIAAALGASEPLIVDCPCLVEAHTPVDILAGMTSLPSWDDFHRAEPDIPHPIVVDEPNASGWMPVYGHLAQWRKQHRDTMGVLRHPPRGHDGYANFMKPKAVLTDGGWAAAGPITLLGGHVSLADAANKVENVWAQVRVIDGKHGPWVCGVMMPHIAADDLAVFRARASQISGYWSGGALRLICSVTAAGYPITESEEQDALVAAFNPAPPQALFSLDALSSDAQNEILVWARDRLSSRDDSGSITLSGAPLPPPPPPGDDPTVDPDDEFDVDAAADERERELALEAEA